MRARIAATFAARARGLLGRSRSWLGEGGVLLIVPCDSVHTFGMRELIDVAFVAANGEVLKVVSRLSPWRIIGCCGAVAVVERFTSAKGDAVGVETWFKKGDIVCLGRLAKLEACQADGKCATISCARH